MKFSRTSLASHHQEVRGILHDLVHSQSSFLTSLARALQNDFIRCLQWSFDGRCICLDKNQSLAEFEHYLNLTSAAVTLACHNRLMSRLVEYEFQLASCNSGFSSQVSTGTHSVIAFVCLRTAKIENITTHLYSALTDLTDCQKGLMHRCTSCLPCCLGCY